MDRQKAQIRVYLRNGIKYQGILLKEDSNFITIQEIFAGLVTINKNSISHMEQGVRTK